MTDRQIKKFMLQLGLVQAVITIAFNVLIQAYSYGKAQADVVHKPDLAVIQNDVAKVKEDVAYIRGWIDNKP